MKSSGREKLEDKIIDSDLTSSKFINKHFVRVGSKGRIFKNVDFQHTYFEHCYFRSISFDTCVFTGCKFINCNFQGSTFLGCTFDYATFEKTYIDSEILETNCPSFNNLTLKFARTLRVNFQGIGESDSVNKAIRIELDATREHLYESWNSKTAYYRKKYQGFDRVKMFSKWLNFKFHDIVWGNGERPRKLLGTGAVIWILLSILDTILFKDPNLLSNFFSSFCQIPSVVMGINKPVEYPPFYLTAITIIRYIGFALFTSILIKRFNRR